MYAVIKEGGKQYKVEPGKSIEIDLKENVKKGDTLELTDVLMVSKEGKTQIGTPTVENAKVISEVQSHTKGKKLVVMKFRRRKDSRTKRGHRQKYTKIKIKEIVSWYTKAGLVFSFSKNQSLVAVIPEQKAPLKHIIFITNEIMKDVGLRKRTLLERFFLGISPSLERFPKTI